MSNGDTHDPSKASVKDKIKFFNSFVQANKDAKQKSATPAKKTEAQCPLKKYRIVDLTLWADAPDDKLVMNNPDRKVEVRSVMTYRKSSDPKDLDSLPKHVILSFSDPVPDNTKKVDSYKYNTKHLGKKDDAKAKYWEAHPEHSASSNDGYKQTCKVSFQTLQKDKKESAKVYFKPSGVGKDDFKLKATLFKQDEKTEIVSAESNKAVVWRKVTFNAYEMTGQAHVSTHGTNEKMAAFYKNATFVRYELGTVTNIAAKYSVKYIGLWDHNSKKMVDWSTHSAKTPGETPTADEAAKANGPPGAARTAARAAIKAKANAWRDRINKQYNSGLKNWAADAGVPVNSLVAIEYEHPKYSAHAPDADSVTNEWSAFPALRIEVEGKRIHPDKRWVSGVGLSYGNRAYITAGDSAAGTKNTIAHEAGHETKNQFKRKPFGAGDHSAAAGLMDPTGSLDDFTAAEIKVLRGLK
jgi:hypothetical protein